MAGLIAKYIDAEEESWNPPGIGVVLAAGAGLVGLVGVYARLEGVFIPDMPYQAFVFGFAYRR